MSDATSTAAPSGTAAPANDGAEAAEATEQPRLSSSIRETLTAKLKGNRDKREKEARAAKAKEGKKPPAAAKKPPGKASAAASMPPKATPQKPKPGERKRRDVEERAEPEAELEREEGDGETEEEQEASPDDERRQIQQDKRKLAKRQRKLDARERALRTDEQRIQRFNAGAHEQIAAFKKDPVDWLRGRGVNVREVLLNFARQDGEDPKDKAAREAKESAELTRAELDELKTERAHERQERAKEAVRERATAFAEKHSADFPYVSTFLEPEQIGETVLDVGIAWLKQHGEELDVRTILDMIETEIRSDEERRASRRGKLPRRRATEEDDDSEPPERVRSVARRESVSPEARRQSRRSAEDVTNRAARVTLSETGHANWDKESVKANLRQMTRERMRH